MTAPAPQPPLLFLDVDGPLIPFGATPDQLPYGGYPTYDTGHAHHRPAADANPLLTRINPAYGPRLLALPCTLVWATTWMSDANDWIAPWLGLPRLPVVDWPDPADDHPHGLHLHWKTRPLRDWAAGRPYVWIDDEITDRDRSWTQTHHAGRALLHRVDPRYGLTDDDFAVIERWLRAGRDGVQNTARGSVS
ncbi:HAD domain-containing protein [Streptomyces sp. NPDC051597]|uniref:HAD domain-containing protein n=1 Tax=Streptomyces sp. NPDC051597 TaxID=3155049 RepID=UPI00344ADB89